MDDTLRRVARTVENRLQTFFEEMAAKPISDMFNICVDSILLEQVRDLTLRGGKRLRAALLVHGAALFDARAEEQSAVIDAAAALELLHAYFLIHDDIMDGDEIRRGGPAVHAALAKKMGDQELGQWLGILAGDLAAALKQVLLTGMDVEESRRHRVLRTFATMHLDVVHGQTLDMLGNASALKVATHKTASYTTIGPLAIGAALTDASDKKIENLAKIALPLGIAFQFRDDLLGTFGSSKITGKPVGTDLKTGKQTILLEEGLRLANNHQREVVQAVLGKDDASPEAIEDARSALEECGARDACLKRIKSLVDDFINGIEEGDYLDRGKRFLLQVARYVAEREE
ncbi:MAG: polyprenyl synthetase family protein [Proteobacteria bacterium]|nr:polyprenyl synthetase family protein [Pseudomonadota bacterium]